MKRVGMSKGFGFTTQILRVSCVGLHPFVGQRRIDPLYLTKSLSD